MRITPVIILLALIILGGAFLRFSNLSWETYSYSEMEIKQAADEYVKGNFINNYYIFDTPPLSKYLFAMATALNNSEVSLRAVSAIFGILTVVALFFFVKRAYDVKTALLAAAITSFSLVHVQFSRYVQPETMLSFFYVMILYFLWEIFNKKTKYTFLFLGVFLGLAMVTKFVTVIIFFAIILYALFTRNIKLAIRPAFSLTIQNWILKSFAVAIILFCLLWPFGFATLQTDAKISVDFGDETRVQEVSTNVPTMVLSFARRIFTSSAGIEKYSPILQIPIVNYIVIYFAKESLIILALFIAGLYCIAKKRNKTDTLIIMFVGIFFILLSLQRFNITYRHIVAVVPFLSIIAARWIDRIQEKWSYIAIAAIMALLFFQAFLTGPSYALYYNPIADLTGLADPESRMSEGMNETLSYLSSNCATTYAAPLYRFIGMYYYNGFVTPEEHAACAINGNIPDDFEQGDIAAYISSNECEVTKTVNKNGVKILDIYKCN